MLYGERARQAEEKAGGDGRRPTRRSGLRRWNETRRMHYGRRRAEERACLRRSRVKRTPTTVGRALEEADGNAMDSVFRLGRKSLVLFLGTYRWMCG